MENYILPVVQYNTRQKPAEDRDHWRERSDGKGRSMLATQVIHNDTLWVGAIHIQAWVDFCGGVLVSSARIQEITERTLGMSYANFGLSEHEVALGKPHVPHLAPELDPYEVIAASLRAAVLTYCFDKKRRMIGWVDKADGRLTAIMDSIGGDHWVPTNLVTTRCSVPYPGPGLDGAIYRTYLNDMRHQVQVSVDKHEQQEFRNINSGNDCALTWCELHLPSDENECGDCGESLYGEDECGECGGTSDYEPKKWTTSGEFIPYEILTSCTVMGAARGSIWEWWMTLPSGEFNNG